MLLYQDGDQAGWSSLVQLGPMDPALDQVVQMVPALGGGQGEVTREKKKQDPSSQLLRYLTSRKRGKLII